MTLCKLLYEKFNLNPNKKNEEIIQEVQINVAPGSHQDHQHGHRNPHNNPQQENHQLQHDDDDNQNPEDLPIGKSSVGISSAHREDEGDDDDDARMFF